jgi:putative holliday junction resolvase
LRYSCGTVKFLGIDYGTERVGVALSNEEGTFAFPKEVILNDAHLFQTLASIVEEEKVGEIVLGQSLNFKREENPVMGDIYKFKKRVEERFKLPVHLEDETLSSAAAGRLQGEHDKIDASAAALILDSFLQKRKNEK